MKPLQDIDHYRLDVTRSLSRGDLSNLLLDIYQRMYRAFGPRHWWPAESPQEVVIGAILVQSVAWANAEKAITQLREHQLLSFDALRTASSELIERCIVSTRYYKAKTRKLMAFADYVVTHYNGKLSLMFAKDVPTLRAELLRIWGIGPETADDIILYAANLPSFVVDAYTKRIFERLGLVSSAVPYDVLRNWFMQHLPHDGALWNEYHALLDGVGHHYCKTQKPICSNCPLLAICQFPCIDPSGIGNQ